jgi:hypothetical protein
MVAPCRVPSLTWPISRTSWPIELHDRADGYVWEMFGPDHVHYVPLRAMTPPWLSGLTGNDHFCLGGESPEPPGDGGIQLAGQEPAHFKGPESFDDRALGRGRHVFPAQTPSTACRRPDWIALTKSW